jgi:[NiFe] hydrogenase small subunit
MPKITVARPRQDAKEMLSKHDESRRRFLKFCGMVAVAMGLGPAFAPQIARALTEGKRPTVVYMHFAECTGCSIAFLRTAEPYLDELLFDVFSLEYHETFMAAAGEAAKNALYEAMESPDGFIAIVEGAIPTAEKGIHGTIADMTMYDIGPHVLPKAKLVISFGTCAAYGGIQAARPNPTGAKGINECYGDQGVAAVNVPGCPPPPANLIGTIAHFLEHKEIPRMDPLRRPRMFYGESVHDLCERLDHFENGEFAYSFESEEAAKGWCLYELGCRGPEAFNNCPKVLFNETSWPVKAGHPCIGCSEPGFWDDMSPFYEA